MEVGDYFWCKYTANPGKVGVFSDVATKTDSDVINQLIPTTSSTTPDGYFRFIMVDNWNGKKMLVADRNIQHTISWDTLNAAGIASGSGINISKTVFNNDGGIKKVVSDLGITVSDTATITGDNFVAVRATNGVTSGKWYYEATSISYDSRWPGYRLIIGLIDKISNISSSNGANNGEFLSSVNKCLSYYCDSVNKTIGIAVDLENYVFTVYLDGAEQLKSPIEPGIEWFPFNASKWASQTKYNFGSRPFKYVPPKGFSPYSDSQPQIKDCKELSVRLLSGGVSEDGNNNEWYEYIINSTLNEKITLGSNDIWNWSGVWSVTSTTPTTSSVNRVLRGNTAASSYSSSTTTSNSASFGFRPVLIIDTNITKSFIKNSNTYKSLKGDSWVAVSEILPSRDIFISDGMPDLSILDRDPATFTIPMDDNTPQGQPLGNGKVFKEKINLKKFIEINSINVK